MVYMPTTTLHEVASFPRSAAGLAAVSPFSEQFISAVSNRNIDPYTDISLRGKQTGKLRYISQPDAGMRELQSWILKHYLQEPTLAHSATYAYVSGRNPIDTARMHVESSWIVKMDLSDFFHSIDERMIYFALRKRGTPKSAAFLLSRLVTRMPSPTPSWLPEKYQTISARTETRAVKSEHRLPIKGFLPQGAPTSGQISNLVTFGLDMALEIFSIENNLRYSRYSDDLFVSANHSLHTELGRDSISPEQVIQRVENFVTQQGFMVNRAKTKVMRKGRRQVILGLLVDGPEARLTREKRSNLDFHLHSVEKYGLEAHTQHQRFADSASMVNYLRGHISYVASVDSSTARSYHERMDALQLL